jgi:hypothetical protein
MQTKGPQCRPQSQSSLHTVHLLPRQELALSIDRRPLLPSSRQRLEVVGTSLAEANFTSVSRHANTVPAHGMHAESASHALGCQPLKTPRSKKHLAVAPAETEAMPRDAVNTGRHFETKPKNRRWSTRDEAQHEPSLRPSSPTQPSEHRLLVVHHSNAYLVRGV